MGNLEQYIEINKEIEDLITEIKSNKRKKNEFVLNKYFKLKDNHYIKVDNICNFEDNGVRIDGKEFLIYKDGISLKEIKRYLFYNPKKRQMISKDQFISEINKSLDNYINNFN